VFLVYRINDYFLQVHRFPFIQRTWIISECYFLWIDRKI